MPEAPRRAVIFGATSAIAEQVARMLAAQGARLLLVGRDPATLAAICDDLRPRGAALAESIAADLDEIARHASLLRAARDRLGAVDLVLVAHGVLADSDACERDPALLERVLRTNFLGTAALCQAAAADLGAHGGGVLVAISSVAGDRGRASNYAYGATKAGLSVFLEGLRSRFHGRGVRVVTVKPGRVDSPMTAHLPHTRVSVPPEVVARAVLRAADGRRAVVYTPWFWRPVMFVVRHLPEAIMRRVRV